MSQTENHAPDTDDTDATSTAGAAATSADATSEPVADEVTTTAVVYSPETIALGRVMYIADHWAEQSKHLVPTGDPIRDQLNARDRAGELWDADELMLRPRYLGLAQEVLDSRVITPLRPGDGLQLKRWDLVSIPGVGDGIVGQVMKLKIDSRDQYRVRLDRKNEDSITFAVISSDR